jgi:hypothetical protein
LNCGQLSVEETGGALKKRQVIERASLIWCDLIIVIVNQEEPGFQAISSNALKSKASPAFCNADAHSKAADASLRW